MFPLKDENPTRSIPWVTVALVAVNLLAMAWLAMQPPPDGQLEVIRLGFVPARVAQLGDPNLVVDVPLDPAGPAAGNLPAGFPPAQAVVRLPAQPVQIFASVFTCMFLHGGLMHIVGNMWFLIIFGDNIEDRFGHAPYLVMYLVSGLAASGLQILTDPSSTLPTVGASGAIAGVMGSYFLLYPHARVVTLIPLGIIWQTVLLPAPIFLGIWFVFQIASAAFTEPGMGGVAFWAHVGGFAAGLGITWWGRQAGWLAPPPRRTPAGWSHEHV